MPTYDNPELQAQLDAEVAKHEQVSRNIADNDRRRHEGNKLVHPAFSYQEALRELEDRRRAFDLDRNDCLDSTTLRHDDRPLPELHTDRFPIDGAAPVRDDCVRVTIDVPKWVIRASENPNDSSVRAWCFGAVLYAVSQAVR